MAMLAGFSDVVCIKRFYCYAAMMSGNVVTTAIALGEKNWDEAFFRLSLIGSYFVGATGVRCIERICRHQKRNAHLKVVALMVVVLFNIARDNIPLLALSYGMVYASANQALNMTITQLLTGHITKLGTSLADRVLAGEKKWNKGSLTSLCIISSFVLGGMFGTWIYSSGGRNVFATLGFVYGLLLVLY
jgi:uncharacterized membrane protein YoaK (UPF0700 family)